MKTPNFHYSNYLISVHFDKSFMPDSLRGKIQRCEGFLGDLGDLARESGIRLFGTFSVVTGRGVSHAHFALNWLPLHTGYKKSKTFFTQPIARYGVIKLLENNFFYVDNPTQSIKRVTHDKKYLTAYVTEQPKELQKTEYKGFYQHPIIEPDHSSGKSEFYCSRSYFDEIGIAPPTGCVNNAVAHSFGILAFLIAISYILLSIF